MTATHDQIEMLLQFMQEHQGLAKGLINGADGRARSKFLWTEIADRLNSLGGAVKSIKQWQKVWADRKYLTKKAAAACRRAQTGTGGGPSTQPPLSDIEQKVVAIMGEGFGMPQTSAVIPAFPNNSAADENTAPNNQECQIQTEREHTPPPPPSTSQNPPRRTRLRFRRQQEDVRTQLVRLEERKIAELAGLRQDIRDLTSSIKECMEHFKNPGNQTGV